jgi:hypothetical protein
MDDRPKNDNATGQGREVSTTDESQFALCFDAPRAVNRKFPDPRHLPGRVLARLLQSCRYTHKDSWLELGHARLADSIWKLRRAGWPVETVEREVATSDCGRPAQIGIYYLTPEAIAEAGEAGQRYAADCLRAESDRRSA